jgi:hypothetical protein
MPWWTDLTFDVKHSQVLDSRKAVENYYAGLFQIRAGKALRSLIITKLNPILMKVCLTIGFNTTQHIHLLSAH